MTQSQSLVRTILIGRGIEIPDSPRHPGLTTATNLIAAFDKILRRFAANTGFVIETHVYSSTTGVPSDWPEIALALGELQFTVDHAALDFGFPAKTAERKRVIEWLRDQAIVRRHRTPHHIENARAEGHINAIQGKAAALSVALGMEMDFFHRGPRRRNTLANIQNDFIEFQSALDHIGAHCGLDIQEIIRALLALLMAEKPYQPTDLLALLTAEQNTKAVAP